MSAARGGALRPNLVLCGFMASGKTTLARLLSEKTGMPVLDTDDWVEQREGRSVSRIFAELGEPYFRSVERRALARAATARETIVATGGGAVLDPENIFRLRTTGEVFFISVSAKEIFARLRGDRSRPLAAGWQTPEQVAAKLAGRAPHYDALPHRVESAGRTAEEIAAEVLRRYEELCGVREGAERVKE